MLDLNNSLVLNLKIVLQVMNPLSQLLKENPSRDLRRKFHLSVVKDNLLGLLDNLDLAA